MAKEDILPYQQNLSLKHAFQQLNLDLEEVMEFTPFDLDLENRRLKGLLRFVQAYQKYGSQQAMEAMEGPYLFPPIHPGLSPESDWYRFELWLEGKPTRLTLSEQLPKTFKLKSLDGLSESEVTETLEQLAKAISEVGYGISLHEGIPPRLVYDFLVETLGETFELSSGNGGWHLDGCSGYCPDCFQRPWCETGSSSCWPEDEEAGKMCLVADVRPFVSASPQSLQILQRIQAEKDAQFEKFQSENKDLFFGDSEEDDSRKAKLN